MLTQSIFLLDFKSSRNWTDFFITGFGSQAVYSGIRWSSPIIQKIPKRARLGQTANEFQLEKSNGQCWSAGSPEQMIVDPPHWGQKKRVMGWLTMPAGGIGSQSRSPCTYLHVCLQALSAHWMVLLSGPHFSTLFVGMESLSNLLLNQYPLSP